MTSYNHAYVWLVIIVASLGCIQWGYTDTIPSSVIGYIGDFLFPGISVSKLSLIASILPIGGALGALLGGRLATKFGRRKILLVTDFITLVGVPLTLISNYESIVIGRLFEGISIGFNSSVVPLYILESVPMQIKGRSGIIPTVLLICGCVLAYTLGFLVPTSLSPGDTNNAWRICLSVVAIFPILRIFFLVLILKLDTPQYLILKNQDEKALLHLQRIYGTDAHLELTRLIKERELANLRQSEGMVSVRDLFSQRFRKVFFIGCILSLIYRWCGLNGIFIYSKYIFAGGKEDTSGTIPQAFSVALGLIELGFTVIASLTVDRFGRKRQLIPTLYLLGLVMVLYSTISLIDSPDNIVAKVMILLWPAFYSLSTGGITFLYMGEVLPDLGMGIATLLNWISAFIISQFFMDWARAIGLPGVFFLFAGITIITTVILQKYMVENKGKTKQEMWAIYNGTKKVNSAPSVAEKLEKASEINENPEEQENPGNHADPPVNSEV